MKLYLSAWAALFLSAGLWIYWHDGYYAPRVTFGAHEDFNVKGREIVHYKWWSVGVYINGNFNCVATFSEERNQTMEEAMALYNKLKADSKK